MPRAVCGLRRMGERNAQDIETKEVDALEVLRISQILWPRGHDLRWHRIRRSDAPRRQSRGEWL